MKPKTQFIEALEPRVAPAILVNGGNLLGGAGNPTTGETSTGANTVTLVKVLTGQALVFYNNGEITGISVGQHTKLDITGDVFGDIVTNLDSNGRLTDSDHNPINGEDGGILTDYGIKGITTHPLGTEKGSIGRIIAGGQINNVNIAGEVAGLYSGNGIFRNSPTAVVTTSGIDTNSVVSGVQDTFTFHQSTSVPNGNVGIKNVTIATARQLEIFAGSGLSSSTGAGSYGGAITNVTIAKTLAAEGSQPVVFLHAGDGGAGTTSGGAGGAITSFNDQGSIAYVKLQTGDGGSAPDGTGGVGGSLTSSTIVSSSTRYDFIMGSGGSGETGGQGGGIQTLTFTNNITGGGSLIATSDLNGDGIPDVILVNKLTGTATVSLGTTTPAHPGEADFRIATQSVLQADGTTLSTPFLPAEGANPTSLVVADLNGDGQPDFVISYASTNSLGVYTNHGNGAFTATEVSLGAISPTRIAVGDYTGSGHEDIAIVSSAATTTAQTGLSSEVFVAANDGAGHLTLNSTPVAVLAGTVTDAAGAQAYDTNGALIGANLFVGFQNGTIDPVFFRGGAASLETTINAFTGQAPVTNVDVTVSGSGDEVLAFTPNINAVANAAGNTTLAATASVDVYALTADGQASSPLTFAPSANTTKAAFVAGTDLVGTVTPGTLSIYGVDEGVYSVVGSLNSDGALSNFSATHVGDLYQFAASGTASNRFFYTSGDLFATTGIASLLPSEVPFEPRSISFLTGDGGNGDQHGGGAGGSIKGLTYTQTLGQGVLQAGGSYNTTLSTGHGGSSNGADGGSGGGINKASLSLNPAYLTYSDDTTAALFQTGAGGQGTTGGNGGSVQKASVTTIQSQTIGTDGINLGSVAVQMLAGAGGAGTAAVGGAGGSITLAGQAAFSGVTFVDSDSTAAGTPGLVVKAGDGGAGVTAGGLGGSLTNVGSQNAPLLTAVVDVNELASAVLTSGNGGDASAGNGGAAGNITGANVVTQQAGLNIYLNNTLVSTATTFKDGSVTVLSGNGGVGHGGTGGKAGAINTSTVASVDGDTNSGYGVLVKAGTGGNGDTGGGAGGALKKLTVNAPADSTLYAAAVVAGNGGDALQGGTGGKGGNISGITQTKDVNSAINVIQAGNGGTGGGTGGSVKNVDTVGFIGLPSTDAENLGAFYDIPGGSPAVAGLFASANVPQGVFAGQGADGASNGEVLDIVARQIAAIGASVEANGHFAVASSVSNVQADLIGYQVNRGLTSFQSADGHGTSPSADVPIDGFILSAVVSNIVTENGSRTSAFTFMG